MANNTRTMAFQIPEDLFQRIKSHLERETARTGRKLTQREFVLGLIEEALETAEQQAVEDTPELDPARKPVRASVSPLPRAAASTPRRSPARAVRSRVRQVRASLPPRTNSSRAVQANLMGWPGPLCAHRT